MRLIVSLNRSRVASRLPVELLRSSSVSAEPGQEGVDLVDRDVGVQRRLREFLDSLPAAAGTGLPPLSAMTVI